MMPARMHGFPYLSGNSFLGVPRSDHKRPYAVAGVPFDGAVDNSAPFAIRPETSGATSLTSNAAASFVWTHLCGLLAARRNT
mgnify:CR=1